jgi:hypothetical protein
VDDGRQHVEQERGVAAREVEVAADEVGPLGRGGRLALRLVRAAQRLGGDRGPREIGRQAKRPPARQQKAVAGLQRDRPSEAVDRQPALARGQRVALDAWNLTAALRSSVNPPAA